MKQSRGNIIFVIFIAIGLFALLSYAVTGGSSSALDIDKEEAQLEADRMMRYLGEMKMTIGRLKILHGCDDSQLSFESAPFDGTDTDYINPNSAGTKCFVFNTNTGGIKEQSFDFADAPTITGGTYIEGLGTTGYAAPSAAELMIIYPNIARGICLELNKMNGVENAADAPPDIITGNASTGHFKGTFTGDGTFASGGNYDPTAACIDPNTVNGISEDGENWFYYSLIIR